MEPVDRNLVTPIYVKADPDMPWPQDSVFYLVSNGGMFLCRNHQFFRSCAPAPCWPRELARQEAFMNLKFPKIPQRLLELTVGFFDQVAAEHRAEAVLLLAWDPADQRVHLVVPKQRSTVHQSWLGNRYPIGVHYDLPTRRKGEWLLYGSIHSHVDGPATAASYTDRSDEEHRPGLHVIVGRVLSREPPEFHCEATVDGVRFRVNPPDRVFEGYGRRRTNVPRAWLEQVEIDLRSFYGKKQRKDCSYDDEDRSAASYAGAYDDSEDDDRSKTDPVDAAALGGLCGGPPQLPAPQDPTPAPGERSEKNR